MEKLTRARPICTAVEIYNMQVTKNFLFFIFETFVCIANAPVFTGLHQNVPQLLPAVVLQQHVTLHQPVKGKCVAAALIVLKNLIVMESALIAQYRENFLMVLFVIRILW